MNDTRVVIVTNIMGHPQTNLDHITVHIVDHNEVAKVVPVTTSIVTTTITKKGENPKSQILHLGLFIYISENVRINNMSEWKIKNINDFQAIISVILKKEPTDLKNKKSATVIALHGDLGSGKTTFTKQLAKFLKIKEAVTSPTFVIQKRFDIPLENKNHGFKKLIHIDTYRIDLQDEIIKLGWNEDVANSQNIISIEWPENVLDILPEDTIHLYFEFVDETTRIVKLK